MKTDIRTMSKKDLDDMNERARIAKLTPEEALKELCELSEELGLYDRIQRP